MKRQVCQQDVRSSSTTIPREIRRIESQEWWLWGVAVAITLALTFGIISFTFPWFDLRHDVNYWVDLREWTRGLAALVLLFDLYAIFQHLQLKRIRLQLAEQQALRRAEEQYRTISKTRYQDFPGDSGRTPVEHQSGAGPDARL